MYVISLVTKDNQAKTHISVDSRMCDRLTDV